MKSITLQEIQDAYEFCSIKPVYRTFGGTFYMQEQPSVFEGMLCGCPQTALYFHKNNIKPTDITRETAVNVFDWAAEEYGIPYAAGFRDGVDYNECEPDARNAQEYEQGYADGRNVGVVIFPDLQPNVRGQEVANYK